MKAEECGDCYVVLLDEAHSFHWRDPPRGQQRWDIGLRAATRNPLMNVEASHLYSNPPLHSWLSGPLPAKSFAESIAIPTTITTLHIIVWLCMWVGVGRGGSHELLRCDVSPLSDVRLVISE